MLTNPITGKIIKQATSNKFLLEVVNNWFPNKYIPTTKVLKQKSSSSIDDTVQVQTDTVFSKLNQKGV